MRYYPWTDDRSDDSYAWTTKTPKEIEAKDFTLNMGISVLDWFPSNSEVTFDFAPNKGIKPADSIPNALGFHIVSEKLKQVLESSSGARFEFLPVRLRNHKKKLLPELYHIANLLDVVTCVDRQRSDFIEDPLFKGEIDSFMELVLDESKLDPGKKIFRLGERPRLVLVREDLVRTILDAGCTGIHFMKLEDFGSEFRTRASYDD